MTQFQCIHFKDDQKNKLFNSPVLPVMMALTGEMLFYLSMYLGYFSALCPMIKEVKVLLSLTV